MLPEPLAVTLQITNFFERLNIPYLLGGSFASIIYGIVRTTQDSDILTEMRKEHISTFVQSLEEEFHIDERMIADAIQQRGSFNIIHRASMFKVDIFISRERPFDKIQVARALTQQLSKEPQVFVKVCTAEDIILAKLEWYRLGGEVSERQWRDVLGVMKVQADRLDIDYLRTWAARLEVRDLLEKALGID